MPLLALIVPAVPAVRARVGSHALRAIVIASGCAAAPACRALAGRLSCASQLWRNIQMLVAAGPMLAADCWPALVHVHRGQLHRDAPDHRDPAQLALHAWLHPQDLWWRAVMTLISALHLTYAGSHSASLACSWRMASLRSSYRCAEHWCWLRAAWASRASKRAAWLWRCCWPSGARGLLHHNHLVCTQTLA